MMTLPFQGIFLPIERPKNVRLFPKDATERFPIFLGILLEQFAINIFRFFRVQIGFLLILASEAGENLSYVDLNRAI